MSVLATETNATESVAPEVLTFRPCPVPTLGVELELQILDRSTGDLAPGAVRILKACEEVGVEGVTAELMQSMVEIKTGVCNTVGEARDQIIGTLKRLKNIAGSHDFDLAMGGTHPFHRSTNSVVFPADRYERVQERLAWLAYQRVVFGLHVHVGVKSGDMAMAVTSLLVQYLPHLLALSANSPFWNGVDTGLASARVALYGLLPHAGVPQYFHNWRDFRSYYRVMKDTRAIQSSKDIYWDIRPNPTFGTIEFRICDMPSDLKTLFGLVTLMHCLVISCQRLVEEQPRLKRGDIRRHWIAIENKWLATRHGLKATYIRSPSGKRRPLAFDLGELVERLMPIAREQGDEKFLKALQPCDHLETGADRQRRLYRETGKWDTLIRDSIDRLNADL